MIYGVFSEQVKNKDEMKKCDQCKYTCKKETSLKKHRLTKHEEHQCQECQMKFMDLLSHIAKQHFEEKIEDEENHEKEDPKDEDRF